jgi:Ca2+-binding EF-hand superfamily protein
MCTVLDTDGDGLLARSDLSSIIEGDDNRINEVWDIMDPEGVGHITFQNFLDWYAFIHFIYKQ